MPESALHVAPASALCARAPGQHGARGAVGQGLGSLRLALIVVSARLRHRPRGRLGLRPPLHRASEVGGLLFLPRLPGRARIQEAFADKRVPSRSAGPSH